MNKLSPYLAWIVTLVTPVVLILSVVRILLFPWFLNVEYNMAGFPPDSYGFTQPDRLRWAGYAVNYLVNDADISYLGDLRFPEGVQAPPESCQTSYEGGDCNRLYNDRELAHMQDVKVVTQKVLDVWRYALFLLGLLGIGASFGNWGNAYRFALGRGGWMTAFLCGTVVVLSLLSFGMVFVTFHDLFFAQGSWTFLYSDTLIRLFPVRFWQDIFLYALGVPGLIGVGLGLAFRKRE
jgi:integral membrane protein (TIGR01906 family)